MIGQRVRYVIGGVLLGLLITHQVLAVVVVHLNQAEILVPSQSPAALPQALKQAMSEVLVKLSGNTDIATLPEIQTSLLEAKDLVTQYRYSQSTLGDKDQWLLTATFNQDALQHVLVRAGQNIWKSDRPSLLFWVNYDDHYSPASLLSNATQDTSAWIQYLAFNRGLTVLFPEMDLSDQNDKAKGDHAFMTSHQANDLLQRYGVEALLQGQVNRDVSGQWHAQWKLLMEQQPFIWEDEQASSSALWQSLATRLVTIASNQSVVMSTSMVSQDLRLDIANVNDVDDYSQVMSLLRGFNGVSHLQVSNMDGTHLLLNVTLTGDEHAFAKLMREHHFYAISPALLGQHARADLFFSLGKPVVLPSTTLPSPGNESTPSLGSATTYPLLNQYSDHSVQELQ